MNEQSFISYVTDKLRAIGKRDIVVSNIRFWENGDVIADVSYIWNLNGWDKRTDHKDSIFVRQERGYISPSWDW